MLKLEGQKAKIAHLNIGQEMHGNKPVIRCDLKLQFKRESDSLNELADHLQHVFYWDKKQPDIITLEHCPNLREANLGQQKWNKEYTGYGLAIPYGIDSGEQATCTVESCKLNEVKFTPEEGGTVQYEARLQFYTEAATRGLLSEFIGTEREVWVIPPAVEEQPEKKGKRGRKGKSAAEQQAEAAQQSLPVGAIHAALVEHLGVRDAQGWYTHPEFPGKDGDPYVDGETFLFEKFEADYGMETEVVSMETDSDAVVAWADYERDGGCEKWQPKTPDGDGWILLCIYDTESGPMALYARPVQQETSAPGEGEQAQAEGATA